MIAPYYHSARVTLYNADCIDVMRDMPDNSVDIILTDPPYGMNFQSNHRIIKHSKIANDEVFPVWVFEEANRIAKRAVYVFCRWDNLASIPKPTSVLAWIKNNWSMGDLKHEHGRQWEAVCFYPQSDHEFKKRIPDVIVASRTGNVFHPTEKPVGLMEKIISANVGDLIFDPFMGSGSTGVAAMKLNRRFIGVELSEEYCEIAKARIHAAELMAEADLFKPKG